MTNEFGIRLDRNGYAPSIMQRDCGFPAPDGREAGRGCCAECGRSWGAKLDRHEPWGGANRRKSQALGMWVLLCHFGCHEGPGSVHDDAALGERYRKDAQRAAMLRYGWSRAEFIRRFGRSALSEGECARSIPAGADRAAVAETARRVRMEGSSAGGFRVLVGEPDLPY